MFGRVNMKKIRIKRSTLNSPLTAPLVVLAGFQVAMMTLGAAILIFNHEQGVALTMCLITPVTALICVSALYLADRVVWPLLCRLFWIDEDA